MTIDTQDVCVPTPAQKKASSISQIETHLALALTVTGIAVVASGILDDATAQVRSDALIYYPDERVVSSTEVILSYLEGSFGAFIMAAAGIAAILCAVFRKWKASGVLLFISVATFIGRSLMETLYNYVVIK